MDSRDVEDIRIELDLKVGVPVDGPRARVGYFAREFCDACSENARRPRATGIPRRRQAGLDEHVQVLSRCHVYRCLILAVQNAFTLRFSDGVARGPYTVRPDEAVSP